VFVVAPYFPDPQQRLRAKRPALGPCAGRGGEPCRLFLDHRRSRKTGPVFALEVLRCRSHGLAFTLYPPGHVPYGRVALAPVAPDGRALVVSETGASRFQGTLFEAALDAAQGRTWPQEAEDGHADPRFPTQRRRLARACQLLGVAPSLEAQTRACIGSILGVAGQLLHDGACDIEQRPGLKSRAEAVVRVLDALGTQASLFDRLAACGHGVGLWPALHRWHPDAARLQRPFLERFARSPPAP